MGHLRASFNDETVGSSVLPLVRFYVTQPVGSLAGCLRSGALADVLHESAVHHVGGPGDVIGVTRSQEDREAGDLGRLSGPLPRDALHLRV